MDGQNIRYSIMRSSSVRNRQKLILSDYNISRIIGLFEYKNTISEIFLPHCSTLKMGKLQSSASNQKSHSCCFLVSFLPMIELLIEHFYFLFISAMGLCRSFLKEQSHLISSLWMLPGRGVSEKVSAVSFCLGSGLFGSCNSD